MVEHRTHNAKDVGSVPARPTMGIHVPRLAILVCNQNVKSSILFISTTHISGYGNQTDSKLVGQSSILWGCANTGLTQLGRVVVLHAISRWFESSIRYFFINVTSFYPYFTIFEVLICSLLTEFKNLYRSIGVFLLDKLSYFSSH